MSDYRAKWLYSEPDWKPLDAWWEWGPGVDLDMASIIDGRVRSALKMAEAGGFAILPAEFPGVLKRNALVDMKRVPGHKPKQVVIVGRRDREMVKFGYELMSVLSHEAEMTEEHRTPNYIIWFVGNLE